MNESARAARIAPAIMAHIPLPEGLPGISGLLAFRPETAKPLRALAEALLRGPSTLTSGEREMIATFVSARNYCHFCQASHRAAAAHHLDGDYGLVDGVRDDFRNAPVSAKFKALLAIAARVQESGSSVAADDIAQARVEGATDLEIHDTVLIAAAFCMYNRYVDGLATFTPVDERAYDEMGARMAKAGYTAGSADAAAR
ncbi:MAG TPA: peroxidase-related enzyme [Bryobacteraceae bacterium]|nr:peroxidase-related enzyme [Bryobacteraceae bacterium]